MGTKHYARSFKEKAVKSSKQRGSVNAVARESGISSSQLSKWIKDFDAGRLICNDGRYRPVKDVATGR